MGKKSGPKSPDYKGAALAEGQMAKELNAEQTFANRPNVSTPWGRTSWTPKTVTDPATGKQMTTWEQSVSLDPTDQASLGMQRHAQFGRSASALGMLDDVQNSFSQPMDYSGMPGRAQNVSPFSFGGTDFRQKSQDAVMELGRPMMENRRESERSRLLNQGISEGSEAWSNAMRDVSDAENRFALDAIETGRGEADQAFRQATGALDANIRGGTFNNMNRSSAIDEEIMRRGLPLDEMNALLAGQGVGMPEQPGFNTAGKAETPDLMGAMSNRYQSDMNRHNAKVGSMNNLGSAAAQAAAMYFMFSDARLKEDVETVGIDSRGLRVVRYRYRGLPGRYIGVIAQEAAKVYPNAVALHPSGFLMVDYSQIGA